MTQFYTIQELSAEVGGDVTPRTIRYYIAEGLLPKPDERGQYTQNHLQRLLLIRRYREAFVPLEKIRTQLVTLTDAQVAETLRETPSLTAPTAPKETAADYTARLLAGLGSQVPSSAAPSKKVAPPAPGAASMPSGSPDLQATLSLHRQLNERNADREASKPTDAPPTETWERVLLAPGVELHRRVPLTSEAETYLQRLLAYARTLPVPAE